jgi:two-component system, chemotaxis family, response regulator Rcp1
LYVAENGELAIAFLRRQGVYADASRPDLILLDLNLPGKSGHEVLAEIKADQSLRSVPVIILTTSRLETDVLKAYNLQANAYIVKPVDLQQFIEAMRAFDEFWLAVVKLPSSPAE